MNALQPNHFHGKVRRRAALAAAAALMVALAGGCASAPPKPQSMTDPQANFGAYRTFVVHDGGGAGAAGQTQTIVEGYIRNALTNQMKSKGYVEAAAGDTPDLFVEYEAAKSEKLKNNPFRIGIGVGGYGSSGGASVGTSTSGVKEVTEGSLVIHVVDVARNAEAWRSGITRELGKGNIQQATVDSAVAEAFKDLPARTAQ